jgi:protein disulfide-isomerase
MKRNGLIVAILLFCFISIVIAVVYQSNASTKTTEGTIVFWTEDFESALNKARLNNKPIFMLFTGSDWCPPCMALEREVFGQSEFKEFAKENFVLFKADRPRNIEQSEALREQNQGLFTRFEVVGVPTIKIIDYKENVLAITGYQAGGVLTYIDHIRELLQ